MNEIGYRLLYMDCADKRPRNRWFEPSEAFSSHTLAVTEAYVRIREICDEWVMQLITIELEPECWRTYPERDGRLATLKPDMFVTILNWEYEYRYFLEVNKNTEAPSVVVEKCKKYANYWKTGAEQKKTGVFPLVVWVTPDEKRRDSLRKHIAACRELRPKNIFLVITQDEFEPLLKDGADVFTEREAG